MNTSLAALFAFALVWPGIRLLGEDTETIVLIRHGEKPVNEFGQLSVEGLNRALALPAVLLAKFKQPDYIFAPGTSDKIRSKKNDGVEFDYLRALATIEPTAIRFGLPVNTDFGFLHIQELEDELLKEKYQNTTIFVAWEHNKLDELVRKIMADLGAQFPVPPWPHTDFDTIFVLTIRLNNGRKNVEFRVDHEGITPGRAFPAPAPK